MVKEQSPRCFQSWIPIRRTLSEWSKILITVNYDKANKNIFNMNHLLIVRHLSDFSIIEKVHPNRRIEKMHAESNWRSCEVRAHKNECISLDCTSKTKKSKNENLCRSRRFSCLFNYWLIGLQNWLRLLLWQYYMLRRLLCFESIFLFYSKAFFEDIWDVISRFLGQVLMKHINMKNR